MDYYETQKKYRKKSFKVFASLALKIILVLPERALVFKEGKVIVGAKAFLEIWKIIPKYRILYHLFKFKIFYIILFIFYEIAALFLYLKNKHLLKNEKKPTSN